MDLSASTGCPPRPCTLGSVPSDSPRVGVDAPEDDALPELAWETILAIFARAGETDHLLGAMQDLVEIENLD